MIAFSPLLCPLFSVLDVIFALAKWSVLEIRAWMNLDWGLRRSDKRDRVISIYTAFSLSLSVLLREINWKEAVSIQSESYKSRSWEEHSLKKRDNTPSATIARSFSRPICFNYCSLVQIFRLRYDTRGILIQEIEEPLRCDVTWLDEASLTSLGHCSIHCSLHLARKFQKQLHASLISN